MNDPKAPSVAFTDPDDLDNNPSANTALGDVIATRMHRRHLLRGGVGALAAATLGPMALSACGGGGSSGGFPIIPPAPAPAPAPVPAPPPPAPAPAPAAGPAL